MGYVIEAKATLPDVAQEVGRIAVDFFQCPNFEARPWIRAFILQPRYLLEPEMVAAYRQADERGLVGRLAKHPEQFAFDVIVHRDPRNVAVKVFDKTFVEEILGGNTPGARTFIIGDTNALNELSQDWYSHLEAKLNEYVAQKQ